VASTPGARFDVDVMRDIMPCELDPSYSRVAAATREEETKSADDFKLGRSI
jgi:hypothetical protein